VPRGSGKILGEVRPMITMVFDPPKWQDDDALLSCLFSMYDVYEVLKSPFLLGAWICLL